MTIELNLEVTRGSTLQIPITMQQAVDTDPLNGPFTGAFDDVTGWQVWYQIRPLTNGTPPSGDGLIECAAGTGVTLGGALGTIDIEVTDEQSLTLTAGSYAHECKYDTGDGKRLTLFAGTVNVAETAVLP